MQQKKRPRYHHTIRVTLEDLKRVPKRCKRGAVPAYMEELLCTKEWLESRRHPKVPPMIAIEVRGEHGEHYQATFDGRVRGAIKRFVKAAR